MASISVPCSNTAAAAALHPRRNGAALSFHRASKPVASLSLGSTFSGIQWPSKKGASLTKVQAQLSEVVAKESANHSPLVVDDTQSEVKTESTKNRIPDAASFSEFMDQVSHLVKLVDSRDIMELKLKQLDCEIEIRKKEALPQPTPPAPVMMMQSPYQHAMPPPPPPPPASASPAPVSAAAPTLALPPPAKAASSHPPFKCPMAGTFYRSPAPGEPPFVKVGDKVQKGQVVCIIEAMKLMNEIEADKSGTITEVLADDGKPVSVDTPLFVIAP